MGEEGALKEVSPLRGFALFFLKPFNDLWWYAGGGPLTERPSYYNCGNYMMCMLVQVCLVILFYRERS